MGGQSGSPLAPCSSPAAEKLRWALSYGIFYFVLLAACSVATAVTVEKWDGAQGMDTVRRRDPPTYPPLPCACHPSGGNDADDPESLGARLAYVLTVHNTRTMEDAVHLFRAIRAPRAIVVVHVDKKLGWDAYLNSTLHMEIEHCPCGADVHIDSVYDCKWGSWSMNAPTHWGMDILVNHPQFRDQWDVFINLSGDTMPVYSPTKVSQLFDPHIGPLRGLNFVTSISCATGLVPTNVFLFPKWWHKRKHYSELLSGGHPTIRYVDENGEKAELTMEVHFGSQWMALLPDFVSYLVTSLKREDSLASVFKRDLIKSRVLMTDETFIPTLLVHVYPFNETLPPVLEDGGLETLPSMRALRYERMDEHVPDAFGYFPTQQRYDVPDSSKADKPKVWGPYFLGVYDLANIKDSGALFVRKVSVAVDPNIVHMLPVSDVAELPSIQWPAEVRLSEVPDWEATKAKLILRAREKQEKEARKKGDRKDGDEVSEHDEEEGNMDVGEPEDGDEEGSEEGDTEEEGTESGERGAEAEGISKEFKRK